jgi:hypothetical protein
MGLKTLLLSLGIFFQNNDTMTLPSQTLSITIQRSAEETYAYLSNPANMPEWAAGLCLSIAPTDKPDIWLAKTVNGDARVRFTAKNAFGIADHYVTIGNNPEVYIPMRVIANGNGSEVLFTLFRLPDMTDEKYKQDMAAVQKDLWALRKRME